MVSQKEINGEVLPVTLKEEKFEEVRISESSRDILSLLHPSTTRAHAAREDKGRIAVV